MMSSSREEAHTALGYEVGESVGDVIDNRIALELFFSLPHFGRQGPANAPTPAAGMPLLEPPDRPHPLSPTGRSAATDTAHW